MDLRPTIDLIFNTVTPAVLTVAIPWLTVRALIWLHISRQSALGDLIMRAAENGAQLALSKGRTLADVAGANVTFDPRVAVAASYVQTVAPVAVARLGLTPDHVETIVAAQIAKLDNQPPPAPTIIINPKG